MIKKQRSCQQVFKAAAHVYKVQHKSSHFFNNILGRSTPGAWRDCHQQTRNVTWGITKGHQCLCYPIAMQCCSPGCALDGVTLCAGHGDVPVSSHHFIHTNLPAEDKGLRNFSWKPQRIDCSIITRNGGIFFDVMFVLETYIYPRCINRLFHWLLLLIRNSLVGITLSGLCWWSSQGQGRTAWHWAACP